MKHGVHDSIWAVISIAMLMVAGSCSKSKNASQPPSALRSSAPRTGSYALHGTERTSQIDVFDSAYTIHDTTITLTVLNYSTVAMDSTRFRCIIAYCTDSMRYYWYAYQGTDIYIEASISYYTYNDSLVFDQLQLIPPKGYNEKVYHTF